MTAVSHRIEQTQVFRDPKLRLNVLRLPSHGAMQRQHSHDFHEVVLILGGHGRHAVGEQEYDLDRGDVFVVLGDLTHGYPETDHLSVINIIYDPSHLSIPHADLGALPGYHRLFTIEPRVRPEVVFRNRLRLSTDQLARATQWVARIEDEIAVRRHGYVFMATAHLMQLIGYLARCASDADRRERQPVSQLSEALGYMERHYAAPLSLNDLAREAGMSPASLTRNFRRVMGQSPIDHLIRLRVSHAERLLRQTALNVTEIAFQVGFNDSNYFARTFRRIVGCPPREYRRR